jgi:3-isopropylmalate dehydrogenase
LKGIWRSLFWREKIKRIWNYSYNDLCSIQRNGRIAHLAFKSAQNRRHKVTMVDKANVLEETSRLWKVVKTVSESYQM